MQVWPGGLDSEAGWESHRAGKGACMEVGGGWGGGAAQSGGEGPLWGKQCRGSWPGSP